MSKNKIINFQLLDERLTSIPAELLEKENKLAEKLMWLLDSLTAEDVNSKTFWS